MRYLDLTSAIQPSWHNAETSALAPCRPVPYGLATACLLLAASLETGGRLTARSAQLQVPKPVCLHSFLPIRLLCMNSLMHMSHTGCTNVPGTWAVCLHCGR